MCFELLLRDEGVFLGRDDWGVINRILFYRSFWFKDGDYYVF